MKIPGRCGKHKMRSLWAMIAIVAFILMVGLVPAYAAGGGDGHSPPWLITDTAKVLNFAVLAIALFLVLRKPVSQALNDRIKGIKAELEDLEGRKAAVEKQLAEYDTKLATLDKAESAAEKLKDQAHKNIEHEFKQAKQDLQAEIVEKALVKAEAMIKDKISDDDQNRLVDEYLEKVVA